jgi:AAA+ ATPase superfamily predicted ATPase
MKDGFLSPFLFGKTVVENEFINRTSEIEHLWLNLLSGINTILISPRRLGKSSLVRQTSILKKETQNTRWCFIDMFSIRNEQAFYEKFCTELLKATSTKWNDLQKNIKEFFKVVIPQITISADDFSSFKLCLQWNDIERDKAEILNLPETIAQKLGIKLIVCLEK